MHQFSELLSVRSLAAHPNLYWQETKKTFNNPKRFEIFDLTIASAKITYIKVQLYTNDGYH